MSSTAFLSIHFVSFTFNQYIEEVVDCSQDESKNDVRTKKATQGMLGVHRQTFNIFKQTNEFSDVLKNKKTSKTRPLIEVCTYVCMYVCVFVCALQGDGGKFRVAIFFNVS